jgi:hypothetical protein
MEQALNPDLDVPPAVPLVGRYIGPAGWVGVRGGGVGVASTSRYRA